VSELGSKSVLDNVPIDDKVLPLRKNLRQLEDWQRFSIVSNCIKCGAPIYGPKEVTAAEQAECKFTCNCRQQTEHLKGEKLVEFSDMIHSK